MADVDLDCFESGLVERLTLKYPDLDVPGLAAHVAEKHWLRPMQSPSGYLVSACAKSHEAGHWKRGGSPGASVPHGRHLGVDHAGNVLRSSEPFTNRESLFFYDLIRSAREKYLSPADVCTIWLASPFHGFASGTMRELWPKRGRFELWECVPCYGRLESFVALSIAREKDSDRAAWERRCDEAEAVNGLPSRYAVAADLVRGGAIAHYFGEETAALVLERLDACALEAAARHAEILAERERLKAAHRDWAPA